MAPIVVIRCSSVLRRVLLLLCMLTASAVLRGQINVPAGAGPLGVGVNPATNKVYVSNFNDNTVTVIDGLSIPQAR